MLVGSVAGQRYWSSMLNLESTITCGIWTPDDQQVYFGTTQGQVIVMDVHGAMVSQVQLSNDVPITSMAWSCEKFKMEEGEEAEPGVTNAGKEMRLYTWDSPIDISIFPQPSDPLFWLLASRTDISICLSRSTMSHPHISIPALMALWAWSWSGVTRVSCSPWRAHCARAAAMA